MTVTAVREGYIGRRKARRKRNPMGRHWRGRDKRREMPPGVNRWGRWRGKSSRLTSRGKKTSQVKVNPHKNIRALAQTVQKFRIKVNPVHCVLGTSSSNPALRHSLYFYMKKTHASSRKSERLILPLRNETPTISPTLLGPLAGGRPRPGAGISGPAVQNCVVCGGQQWTSCPTHLASLNASLGPLAQQSWRDRIVLYAGTTTRAAPPYSSTATSSLYPHCGRPSYHPSDHPADRPSDPFAGILSRYHPLGLPAHLPAHLRVALPAYPLATRHRETGTRGVSAVPSALRLESAVESGCAAASAAPPAGSLRASRASREQSAAWIARRRKRGGARGRAAGAWAANASGEHRVCRWAPVRARERPSARASGRAGGVRGRPRVGASSPRARAPRGAVCASCGGDGRRGGGAAAPSNHAGPLRDGHRRPPAQHCALALASPNPPDSPTASSGGPPLRGPPARNRSETPPHPYRRPPSQHYALALLTNSAAPAAFHGAAPGRPPALPHDETAPLRYCRPHPPSQHCALSIPEGAACSGVAPSPRAAAAGRSARAAASRARGPLRTPRPPRFRWPRTPRR